MKILKYFFYVLLVVFVLFLGVGLVSPVLEYEAEVTINANRTKCWQVFNDDSKMAEWIPNFKSINPILETEEIIGSKYLITVEENGELYEMTETIIEFAPEERFVIEIENNELINKVVYTFDDSGNSTLLAASNQLRGKGVLMKAIFPLMKGMFASQTEDNLQRLKGIIESS